jgi:hypothetical protein
MDFVNQAPPIPPVAKVLRGGMMVLSAFGGKLFFDTANDKKRGENGA